MSHLGVSGEATMNDKAGGSRRPWRAAALAVAAAAVAVLTTACGVHVSFGNGSGNGSASTGSATFLAELAFAHCMQTHGVPNFPDPTNANQGFGVSGQLKGNPTGPLAQAHNACEHLLRNGTSATGTGSVTQAQLDQALKIAQCLRAHGEPTFPDPTVVNGSLRFTVQPGVIGSARFQTAVTACRSLIPKGVNFP
jgi:hypothetical protein